MMSAVMENGTAYRAANGNVLYRSGKTIVIENFMDLENGGTMFNPDNIGRFIGVWIHENGGL